MRGEGRINESIELYRKSLSISPTKLWIFLPLVEDIVCLGNYNTTQWKDLLSEMKYSLSLYGPLRNITQNHPSFPLVVPGQGTTYYALYLAAEKANLFDEAWSYLEVANNLEKRRRTRYPSGQSLAEIDYIASRFSKHTFENKPHSDSEDILFILGMPDSGFKYLEAILDKHSAIFAINANASRFQRTLRSYVVPDLFHSIFVFHMKEIKQLFDAHSFSFTQLSSIKLIEDIRAKILKDWVQTAWVASEEPHNLKRIIDCHHNLYRYVGFIHILFPKATIINVLRDPLDTIFGGHRHALSYTSILSLEWLLDPNDLQGEYMAYLGMLGHWEAMLPGRILHIQTEKLLDDPEGVLSPILSKLGLAWEAGMEKVDPSTVPPPRGAWHPYAHHLAGIEGHLRNSMNAFIANGFVPLKRSIDWTSKEIDPAAVMRRYHTATNCDSVVPTEFRSPQSLSDVGSILDDLHLATGVYVGFGDGLKASQLLSNWTTCSRVVFTEVSEHDLASRKTEAEVNSAEVGDDTGAKYSELVVERIYTRLKRKSFRGNITYSDLNNVEQAVNDRVDILYVDDVGGSYCSVRKTLMRTYDLVKPGGVLAGSGYTYDRSPQFHSDYDGHKLDEISCAGAPADWFYQAPRGVKGAVDDFLHSVNITYPRSVMYIHPSPNILWLCRKPCD